MGDLGNLAIAFCGISAVCCGAVLLALFLLARVTGRSVLLPIISIFGNMFLRGGDSQDEDEIDLPTRRSNKRSLRPSGDTRRRSLDEEFDAAFTRNERSQSPDQARQSKVDPNFELPDTPALRGGAKRTSRRDMRRSTLDAEEDEIMGGMLDEDGDSFPDS